MQEMWLQSLGREDPLESEMATHSSTLTWEITWTENLGRLPTGHGVAKSWNDLMSKQQQSIYTGSKCIAFPRESKASKNF